MSQQRKIEPLVSALRHCQPKEGAPKRRLNRHHHDQQQQRRLQAAEYTSPEYGGLLPTQADGLLEGSEGLWGGSLGGAGVYSVEDLHEGYGMIPEGVWGPLRPGQVNGRGGPQEAGAPTGRRMASQGAPIQSLQQLIASSAIPGLLGSGGPPQAALSERAFIEKAPTDPAFLGRAPRALSGAPSKEASPKGAPLGCWLGDC